MQHKFIIYIALFNLLAITLINQKVKAQEITRDSLTFMPDTIQTDSVDVDSVSVKRKKSKKDVLTEPVQYSSSDSIILEGKNITFYKLGQINYGEIELKADYIKFNMDQSELFAQGLIDTSGQMAGEPIFTQGEDEFKSKTMRYNFKSRKTYVKEIITEEEDGFLHSENTKRLPNGEIHVKNGKFTVCDAEHPHFYVGLTKAIVIPNEKIISGPAYMVLADIPLPLVLPFGFFPNTSKKAMSGFLIPTWGEENIRGYYLRQGGFYWAINDYLDARMTADVYSRGSWGMQMATNYRKRYKFSGSFNGTYFLNKSGEEGINLSKTKDYRIQWSHRQDAKANPNSTFSASVNYSTTSFDRNQSFSLNERLTNTKSSSISYQKSWPNSPFSLSATANHSQNSRTNSVNMTLPNVNFNMARIYPFRSKNMTGKPKWYQNIQLSYTSRFENSIQTTDSALFDSKYEDFEKGYQHNIPLSINFKLFKLLNFSPGINYSGVVFTDYIEKYYDPDSISATGKQGVVITNERQELRYAHGWSTSFGTSISPKIYGMYEFKKGRMSAIRHVITPTASFSYTPDMKSLIPDYYRYVYNIKTGEKYIDENGNDQEYSIFANQKYSTPTAPGRSGSVRLGIRNNIEAKRFAKNDTTGKPEKISILDNLDFNTSYSPFSTSKRKWSDINMSSRTTILKKKVSLQVNGRFSPYTLDSLGRTSPEGKFEWEENHKLLRLTNLGGSVGMSFRSQQGNKKSNNRDNDGLQDDPSQYDQDDMLRSGGYGSLNPPVDFDIPWSIRVNYNFSYQKSGLKPSVIQTLRLSGDFSLTPKWKVTYNSGYDFKMNKITATSLTISRDLHCWQMSLSTVPFGDRSYFEFNIQVNPSSILRDLKYDKRWDKRYEY